MSIAARGFYLCPECHAPRMRNPFSARCRPCTAALRRDPECIESHEVEWVGPPRPGIGSFVTHVKASKERFVVSWDPDA